MYQSYNSELFSSFIRCVIFTVLYCTILYSDNDVVRLDTGEDQRVDKEEFTSDKMKETLEKVTRSRSRIF